MLKLLTVQNYALIKELTIDFENGFSTITGETGAGKSILLGALSLVLGSRADTTVLSNDESKCVVEAHFDISRYHLAEFLNGLDLDYQDVTILRREIGSNGKSRAFVNDTPVNLQDLKEFGNKLVDVHSQHENLELNNNLFQLRVLDSVANNHDLLTAYHFTFQEYKKELARLNELQAQQQQSSADYEYNLFQLTQLTELNPEKINQQELEEELQLLENAEEIQRNLGHAFQCLSEGDQNILEQIKQVKLSMEQIQKFFHRADEFLTRIESIDIELKDMAAEIEQTADRIEYQPERIVVIKDQLDKLYTVLQKHQVSTSAELVVLMNQFQQKVEQRDSFMIEIEKSKKQLNELLAELTRLSGQLTSRRKESVLPFSSRVKHYLNDLGMPNAEFDIQMETTEEFTSSGKDRIGFLFSANKNKLPQNISKIASGGELSRLMLCIKCILSESIALPTIIFDEIDSGVSGEIADKMAEMMNQMASNMQVISITHLPQIAAKGKSHYKVFKEENDDTVITRIVRLVNAERIEEIARMLSGKDITREAIENAKTLITLN